MMLDCTPRWYVVHTHPRAEAKAVQHLDRQGFRVYLPRFLKRRRHARRVDVVAAPLFPRYLFVANDPATQRWRAIQSTIGVTHLVCNGELPAEVGDEIIADIRARENEQGFVRLDQRARFRRGDKLRVLDGAFCDSFGLFEGMTENERVTILLDLLGRKVRVKLGADMITAA